MRFVPNTTSLAFPNMFNVSQNRVTVLEDSRAVVNRDRLLILTVPTELYNEPNFGVGLARHMWKYNNDNEKAIILDRIKEQLRLHEPYVVPEETQYADGLLFTGGREEYEASRFNELEMTISLSATFNDNMSIKIGPDEVSLS